MTPLSNLLMWGLQLALAFVCVAGGAYQITQLKKLRRGVTSMRALPKWVWMLLGAFCCVAGLGLVLPGAASVAGLLGALPADAVPIAAAAVAAHSLLLSAIYAWHGDTAPLPFSLVMGGAAAFISYARFAELRGEEGEGARSHW